MPPAIGAISREVEVENRVGGDTERIEDVDPQRQVGRENEDAAVVVVDAQFAGTATHALGIDTENAATENFATIGHLGTERCERNFVAGRHVERTTPHVQLVVAVGGEIHAVHLFGIGMAFGAQHLRHDDTGHLRADSERFLDGHTERGHFGGEKFDVVSEVGEFVQPREKHFHQENCLRKRRSLVYISRMSSMA